MTWFFSLVSCSRKKQPKNSLFALEMTEKVSSNSPVICEINDTPSQNGTFGIIILILLSRLALGYCLMNNLMNYTHQIIGKAIIAPFRG